MKYGSLFSGIGGFDLGFERAGMECAWQCEIDTHAQEVLRNHFTAEIHNDVRTIGRNAGAVDLICGGFPCQDLSVAGKRKGLAGERSGLWFEFARAIDELEPGWVVIENVPGLLSSNGGRDFAVIIRWLAERGYGVAWRILDAQYFGVPQRRRRVFIVASLGSGRAAEVLFESEGLRGNPPTRKEAGQGFAEVAGTLASSGGGMDRPAGNANELDFCIPELSFSVATKVRNSAAADGETLLPAIAYKIRGGKEGGGKGYLGSEKTAFSLTGFNDQYLGVRRLTPTECERLQGFPDGWTAGQSDTQRYKQLGNAVAVPCAEWIGRRIMEAS